MIWTDALFSFLHFLALLIMVGSLASESGQLRRGIDAAGALQIARTDAFYGGAAGLLIVAGLLRVFFGAKPADFYLSSPFFWAKMATFAAIALVSVGPTRRFFAWRKAARADASFQVSAEETQKMRRLVMIQMHLLPFVILFAVLMARGYGM